MESSVTYFEEPGPQNTDAVIAVAKNRITESGIESVIVASESGKTAIAVAEVLRETNVRIVCVAPYAGYQHVRKKRWPAFGDSVMRKLETLGVNVVDKTPWIFGCTFDVALLKNAAPAMIVHKVLSRTFGFGVKTCIEVALIAAEAGAVSPDKDAIAIAGTGWLGGGADAAIVIKPAPIFEGAFLKNDGGIEVREILAMPRSKFNRHLIELMKKAGKDEPI